MYFFIQLDEQSGWIRFNTFTEGALQHNRAIVPGNVMRDSRGWIQGLASAQCTTLAWRNRLFNLVNGKVGFNDTRIQCAPVTTACIPSKSWKWVKAVSCGRPPHLLFERPEVTIIHDRALSECKDDTCWFCCEIGHTRVNCPLLAAHADSEGVYECPLRGKRNAHSAEMCNRHCTYGARMEGEQSSSSSSKGKGKGHWS